MEQYIRLSNSEVMDYVHMIPTWLIEHTRYAEDVEFWGMKNWSVPCGVAVLTREDRIMTLKHLYIDKKYRGGGRGTRFLQQILQREYKKGETEFQVQYIPGQYPEFERLLRRYNWERKEELIGSANCTIGELAELKYLQGNYGNTKALSECTEESLHSLYQEIKDRGVALVDLPIKKEDYLAEYSAVTIEDGKPAGLLLVKKEDKDIVISYLVNLSSNVAAPIEMMRFVLQKGSGQYSPETKCRFAVVSETLLQLLEKIGINTIQKRQCCRMDLSWFSEAERMVNAYVDVQLEIHK
ncbi:MAG: hypothetical protein IJ282_05875 [Lachnospiraceae bacterium]|nr:hypothetical protein [Lachnospiraceae bacterium]